MNNKHIVLYTIKFFLLAVVPYMGLWFINWEILESIWLREFTLYSFFWALVIGTGFFGYLIFNTRTLVRLWKTNNKVNKIIISSMIVVILITVALWVWYVFTISGYTPFFEFYTASIISIVGVFLYLIFSILILTRLWRS